MGSVRHYTPDCAHQKRIFNLPELNHLNHRSFLPFKITWLHLPGFVVELAKLLRTITIGMNIIRLATVVSNTFKLTFKLIGNINFVDNVI